MLNFLDVRITINGKSHLSPSVACLLVNGSGSGVVIEFVSHRDDGNEIDNEFIITKVNEHRKSALKIVSAAFDAGITNLGL